VFDGIDTAQEINPEFKLEAVRQVALSESPRLSWRGRSVYASVIAGAINTGFIQEVV